MDEELAKLTTLEKLLVLVDQALTQHSLRDCLSTLATNERLTWGDLLGDGGYCLSDYYLTQNVRWGRLVWDKAGEAFTLAPGPSPLAMANWGSATLPLSLLNDEVRRLLEGRECEAKSNR